MKRNSSKMEPDKSPTRSPSSTGGTEIRILLAALERYIRHEELVIVSLLPTDGNFMSRFALRCHACTPPGIPITVSPSS